MNADAARRPATRRKRLPAAFALLIAAWPSVLPAADAAPLGRLFLSPTERNALDEQRSRPATESAAAPAATRVVLNGVVQRERGGPVVWINGQAQQRRAGTAGAGEVRGGPDADNRVTVAAPGRGSFARLKPGQTWVPATGAVSDCVQCLTPAPTAGSGGDAAARDEAADDAASPDSP